MCFPMRDPRKKEKKLHQKNTSVEFFLMDESILSFYVYADFPVREFPCMVLLLRFPSMWSFWLVIMPLPTYNKFRFIQHN